MSETNIPKLFETAGKVVASLILLAASASEENDRRHHQRHDHRRNRRHERTESKPPEAENDFPWAPFGGILIAMGILLMVLTIGVPLMLNMAVCLAPIAVIGFIVLAAVRHSENRQQDHDSSVEPGNQSQAEKEPAFSPHIQGKPKVRARALFDFGGGEAGTANRGAAFWKADAGKPHPPAYYRERATGYRLRIQSLIRSRRKGALADTFATILPRLEWWEERVAQLSRRLANFESDKIIQRDIRETPGNITRLQQQMERENHPEVREQMAKTLEGYLEQQAQLEALVRLMRRTRLQLDDTLASMGTIYSQVQMLDAMDLDGIRAAHIAADIEDEISRLNDLLSAFQDVNGAGPDYLTEEARRIRLGRSQAEG